MTITIRNAYDLVSPQENSDVRVIIDVFRASTTALAVLEAPPQEYLIANDLKIIQELANQSYRVVSEVFDLGLDNSPTQVRALVKPDEKIIHKTTNLSTAIELNYFEKTVIIACFNNIKAVVDYIQKNNFSKIEIIPAGQVAKKEQTPEDTHCANLLKQRLQTSAIIQPDLQLLLGNWEEKKKTRNWPPHFIADIEQAVQLDISTTVPKVTQQKPSIYKVEQAK